MIRLTRAEFAKLRGSLAIAVSLLAPALPGLIGMLGLLSSKRTLDWSSIFGALAIPTWAMFLMPMTVAAFANLTAQIEHQARGWDHLFALPVRRWQVFASKLVVVLAFAAVMTLSMLFSRWLGAMVASAITGRMPTGTVPWSRLATVLPMLLACTALIAVIQTWVALRWSSFVVPLCVGMAGTLIALTVAITRSDKADWFPWVLPLKGLATTAPVSFVMWTSVAAASLSVLRSCTLSGASRDERFL